MPTTIASGTQTATIGTEHTLTTQTGAAGYALSVNLTNLAAGERVTVRVKRKVLTGGAEGIAEEATYVGPVGAPVIETSVVSSMFSLSCTLTQHNGTGRSFEWALVSV